MMFQDPETMLRLARERQEELIRLSRNSQLATRRLTRLLNALRPWRPRPVSPPRVVIRGS
jgi:hypothetical protein